MLWESRLRLKQPPNVDERLTVGVAIGVLVANLLLLHALSTGSPRASAGLKVR